MSSIGPDHSDSNVWGLKYRPKTIDECVLPAQLRTEFTKILESGKIPNLLFHTFYPGSGKTTMATILCETLGYDVLFMNASSQNSIDDIRNTVTNFCSSVSLDDKPKVVFWDECLFEEETVRVGTVDNWEAIALKDLSHNTLYPVVSFNMNSGEFENDQGFIVSDKEDELYEVELVDGTTVILNEKHPFIVKTATGEFVEKTIADGLDVGDLIVRQV